MEGQSNQCVDLFHAANLGLVFFQPPSLLGSLLSLQRDLPSPVIRVDSECLASLWKGDEAAHRVISAFFSSLSSVCSILMAFSLTVFCMRSCHFFVFTPSGIFERLNTWDENLAEHAGGLDVHGC